MTTTRRPRPQRPPPPLRTHHFDVAADEADEQPVTFTYKDETYRCRGAIPAMESLKYSRAQAAGGLDNRAVMAAGLDLMEAMFEAGELDRLLATGISEDRLGSIFEMLLAVYAGEDPNAGEGGPPATGADSSELSSTPSTS